MQVLFILFLLFVSPDNTSFGQIVRRQLDGNFVTRKDTNEVHPQLTTDVSKHLVAIFQFNLEHCVRKLLNNCTFDLNYICF